MEHDDDPTPRRFRTLRPNPFRDVLPWVVVGLGLVLVLRGVVDLGRHGGPEQLLIGVGLAVLGVVVFLINRWQARRGL
ncbi:hypothetical protein [Curtobacterium sp. MCBA15_001]|uniref:hypothetical protein n=1 Tax=Curtobacterium sp. MCBA15_001 TaxID=1898731 RepID=UPI0008DC892D|nr:hypothetical protein [Curtobacterium sp. MCBA15_001]OIH93741.1 hypothetical protein BIU90_08905 [Curtobacterium sp. MCBA15_001]